MKLKKSWIILTLNSSYHLRSATNGNENYNIALPVNIPTKNYAFMYLSLTGFELGSSPNPSAKASDRRDILTSCEQKGY